VLRLADRPTEAQDESGPVSDGPGSGSALRSFSSTRLLILIYGLGDANVPGVFSEGRRVFVTKVAHLIIPSYPHITLRFCTLIGECAAGL
jgi:hypothetical protein